MLESWGSSCLGSCCCCCERPCGCECPCGCCYSNPWGSNFAYRGVAAGSARSQAYRTISMIT